MTRAKQSRNLWDHWTVRGRHVKRFLGEEAGTTFVFTALSLSVLLGMAGLGLDAAMWFMAKRQVQNVADVSSLSGASARTKGGSVAEAQQAVIDQAALNGFVHGSHGQVVTNIPPVSGPNAGDAAFVEVVVSQPAPLFFASLFQESPPMIQARAVGGLAAGGSHCLLALDPSLDAALEFRGSADVVLDCGVASNSSSDRAIYVTGNANLEASSAQTYGDILVSGSGSLASDGPLQALSERLSDPYAGLEWPSATNCDYNNFSAQNKTITPGVYCNGMTLRKNITVSPGVYIINEGDLTINGNANVTGADVTFIFMADDPANTGGIGNINGNANVTLSAPDAYGHPSGPYAGDYAGVLMMQHPGAPALAVNRMNGGSDMVLSGALYFPNQEVQYSGGSDQFGCLKIIARKLTFTGNAGLASDPEACADQGVADLAPTRVRVVE